jgi:hypothetical protein
MADLIQQSATGKPLWLNEFGYPDFRHAPNRATMWSEKQDVYLAHEHTPNYQAVQLFKVQLLALASGRVSLVTWYRLHDYAAIADIGGQDAVNQHLGLLDAQGKSKPMIVVMETSAVGGVTSLGLGAGAAVGPAAGRFSEMTKSMGSL